MEEPEPEPRDCVVIARIPQIEEAKDLLVDEIEPEKTVVLPRAAVKREREIGWISKRGQNVPGRCNEECDEKTADGTQPLPGSSDKNLLGQEKIEHSGGDWKNRADQTFQQNPSPQASSENECPEPRAGFLLVEGAQKGPHRQSDSKRQRHIGNNDARE